MKVVAPAGSDGSLRLLEVLEAAAREFNRTLDIRLRFLDIGVDLIPLRPLAGQALASADAWTSRVRQVLERERPRLLLVRASDPAAAPAVAAARDLGVRPVILADGPESEAGESLRESFPEARIYELGDLEASDEGRRLVEILVAERAGP